jgi:motility quorum-sensing regulator/GCU-specific mRNA interferase toxin
MPSYPTPTHDLAQVVALVQAGNVKTTKVARDGATALGLDYGGLLAVVVDLPNKGTFYKTMEAVKDPGHWQDVYHTVTPAGDDVYLKLMIRDGALIVSFKEL